MPANLGPWPTGLARGLLAWPVRSRRLQHAELIAVWITQDVPAPPGLAGGLLRQEPGSRLTSLCTSDSSSRVRRSR